MNVNIIKDALKSLAQSLQAATLFPAAVFVLALSYIVAPLLNIEINTSDPAAALLAAILTMILSYTLYAFNYPLIRLFEGYPLRHSRLLRCLGFGSYVDRGVNGYKRRDEKIRDQRDDLDRLALELGLGKDYSGEEKLTREDRLKWEAVKADFAQSAYDFEKQFPSEESAVLPHRLGNVIAAFEDYPRARYGMESIVLWPRMISLLRDRQYLEFVSQEKSVFDFLLNTLFLFAILGLTIFYINIYLGHILRSFLYLFIFYILCMILYEGLVKAAHQWGSTVRIAFDLYRHELHERLALQPTWNRQDEVKQWQDVSAFYMTREGVDDQFPHFLSQNQVMATKHSSK